MTRTDVMASSRPRTAGVSSARIGSARRAGGLVTLVALLLMAFALVLPGGALAAGESTSGYNQNSRPRPPRPPRPRPAPHRPKKKNRARRRAKNRRKETSTPTSTTSSTHKAGTLPFTGFDLRWSLVLGLVLVGAGFSIVAVQRRERRGSR